MTRIAIGVLLAIAAHTLFMGTVTGAAEHHPAAHAAHGMAAARPAAPDHDGSCFSTEAWVTKRLPPLELATGSIPAPTQEMEAGPPAARSLPPPLHPPNVARALLQVYRI
jgi:hypothetical protein